MSSGMLSTNPLYRETSYSRIRTVFEEKSPDDENVPFRPCVIKESPLSDYSCSLTIGFIAVGAPASAASAAPAAPDSSN